MYSKGRRRREEEREESNDRTMRKEFKFICELLSYLIFWIIVWEIFGEKRVL